MNALDDVLKQADNLPPAGTTSQILNETLDAADDKLDDLAKAADKAGAENLAKEAADDCVAGAGQKLAAPNSGRGGSYGHLDDGPKVGSGKDFTAAQKKRVLEENRKKNGGLLKDDETGEVGKSPVRHQRGVRPPDNEVNVDHYYPKAHGGPNSYSNAEVRLRIYNLLKRDQLPGE